MKSINSILQIVKRELFYQWHSKIMIALLVLLLSLSVTHLLGLHNSVLSSYDRYIKTEKMYQEQGINIVEALSEDNPVITEGNTRIVGNPLKEDFVNLSISIQNLEPQNVLSNTLEFLVFVFCTLVFGIYASLIATYDFRSKTYKVLSIRYSQSSIVLGKIFSIITVMLCALTLTLLFTYLGSFAVKSIVAGEVPVDKYALDIFNYNNGLLPQLWLVAIVILFYIVIGFTIGFVLKNMVVPTILLMLYGLLIPILGAYDFRNIFSFFSHRVFSFNARFVMFAPKQINEAIGIGIVTITLIASFLITLLIASKRSAYD